MIKAGQVKSIEIASHCMVTIRRANGDIETVQHPTIKAMSADLLKRANKAMADAGRGQIISYENIRKTSSIRITAADEATESGAAIERAMNLGE